MYEPSSYTIIAAYFPRLLGIIYFFTFFAFFFQMRGLIGKNGILPIKEFLGRIEFYYKKKKFFYVPSLFWFNSNDTALNFVVVIGGLISLLLLLGVWVPLLLFLLYLLYLSIVSIGQDFLGFGWEGFLLEVTIQAFLLSLTSTPNVMVWFSVNFLLFRFHFMAGTVKLQSKDPNWRNLTAIAYHYQTQPIPNTIAWYAHKFPMWFQKLTVLMMFFIELVVPFGIFLTDEVRFIVFIFFFAMQYMIWLTGNFSFLNYLTVVLCTILLSNHYLIPILGTVQITPTNYILEGLISITAFLLIVLQLVRFWNHYFPNKTFEKILFWISPFHIANRYGIFAIMTTKRFEIIVEGSSDGKEWKEYYFRYKPSKITRRPRRIAPYQPRIDWQAWFLPFNSFRPESWFHKFLAHLLLGTPEVLKLIRYNPFPDKPPKFIRSVIYDYEFSSFEEKRKHGWWWRRKLIGHYSPTFSIRKE